MSGQIKLLAHLGWGDIQPKWVGAEWAPTLQSGEGVSRRPVHSVRLREDPGTAATGKVGVRTTAARGTDGALTVLRSGGRRRSHSRDLAPEVAFPSNSVPASVSWGRSARCLLPPHQAQARGGAGARGAAAWAIPGLGSGRSLRPPGRPRGNKARAPPRAVSGLPGPRPVQPPRLWLAGARLRLPRAHPSVSRGPAAPAPRAPPPPPAPRRRRRCATCLQLGAHRARLRPGAPAAGEGLGLRAGPALERGSASRRPRPRPGAAVDPRARPTNSAGGSRAQPMALNAGASVEG